MGQETLKRWQIAQNAEDKGWVNWRAIRSEYEEQLKKYWRWYINFIEKHVRFNAEGKTLDIGCGPDGMINYVETGKRFGLDPLMESYLATFNMQKGVEWKKGTAEDIPFDSDYFDIVVTTNAIDHSLEPRKGLGEIYRVLKPGGYLVLTVNCYAPFRRLLRITKEKIGMGDKAHPFSYSSNQVAKMIQAADFKLKVSSRGIGTMGEWFYERIPEDKKRIFDRATGIIFWLEQKTFGYSCTDFIFIAEKV